MNKVQQALGLLNSMVLSGEQHSPESRQILKDAQQEAAASCTWEDAAKRLGQATGTRYDFAGSLDKEQVFNELCQAARSADMSPNEYQQLALRTENTPCFIVLPSGEPTQEMQDKFGHLPAHKMARLLHALMGLCTEAGEALDMVKKFFMYGKSFDIINVLEEIGDGYWYAALALDACGFTVSQAMERNIAKLKARFPAGFAFDNALRRDLGKERLALEVASRVEMDLKESAKDIQPVTKAPDLKRLFDIIDAYVQHPTREDHDFIQKTRSELLPEPVLAVTGFQNMSSEQRKVIYAQVEKLTVADVRLYGELIRILGQHVGENGQSEGAVEVLERISTSYFNERETALLKQMLEPFSGENSMQNIGSPLDIPEVDNGENGWNNETRGAFLVKLAKLGLEWC